MKKDNFFKGTLITFISLVFIKIIGAVYVIPFYKTIGESGGALYNYAYQIYNLFYNISTAGIPVALSIILSEYNSLNFQKTKEKTYSVTKKLMVILSLVSFLIMFIFAKQIGNFFVSGIEDTTDINEIAFSIRSISLCLLIIPFLSMKRGYLQAHKYASISSFSQVIEQLVRVFCVLFNSYILIKVFKLKVVYGVAGALLGALFGGIIADIYLTFKTKNNLIELKKTNKSVNEEIPKTIDIIKKTLSYSIPMVLVTILSDLYNIIDTKLIIIGLNKIGYSGKIGEIIASILSTWAPKICVLIMTVATSMITNIIPHIVEKYVQNDNEGVNKKIEEALKAMLLVVIPLSTGICFLSNQIYYVFYGESLFGGKILFVTSILNVISSINVVLNTVLQCMKKFKKIYIYSLIGLVLNIIFDIPMILILNKLNYNPFIGTALSSIIGYSTSCILTINMLRKETGFKIRKILKFTNKTFISNIIMILVLIILNLILPIKLEYSKIIIVLMMMLYAIISIVVYFYIAIKMNILNEVADSNILNRIKKILKINKKVL